MSRVTLTSTFDLTPEFVQTLLIHAMKDVECGSPQDLDLTEPEKSKMAALRKQKLRVLKELFNTIEVRNG